MLCVYLIDGFLILWKNICNSSRGGIACRSDPPRAVKGEFHHASGLQNALTAGKGRPKKKTAKAWYREDQRGREHSRRLEGQAASL